MADKKGHDALEAETKRRIKLTETALEDKIHRLIGARRGVLAQITTKRKKIESLMSEAGDLHMVQEMHNSFTTLVIELKELNSQVEDLLCKEERCADHINWLSLKCQPSMSF